MQVWLPTKGDAPAESTVDDFRTCTDPHAANFLRWLAAGPLLSRVILTSRLFPRDLEGLAGCRREELNPLAPEDVVTFFRAQGVQGMRAEIEATSGRYGNHALALRLLAGMITHDPVRPHDITVAPQYDPLTDLVPRQHHILTLAYDIYSVYLIAWQINVCWTQFCPICRSLI